MFSSSAGFCLFPVLLLLYDAYLTNSGVYCLKEGGKHQKGWVMLWLITECISCPKGMTGLCTQEISFRRNLFQLIDSEFITHFKQYTQNGDFKPLFKVVLCCPWKAHVCAFQKAEVKIFAKMLLIHFESKKLVFCWYRSLFLLGQLTVNVPSYRHTSHWHFFPFYLKCLYGKTVNLVNGRLFLQAFLIWCEKYI